MMKTNMKVNEIVIESARGKKPHTARNADVGEWLFRDEGVDRGYNLNRIMMATAMHDGKTTKAVDMPEASWVEKHNIAIPYTEEEHRMMQGAFKTVSGKYHHTGKVHKSLENNDIHKHSAVPHNAGAKRNKPKN